MGTFARQCVVTEIPEEIQQNVNIPNYYHARIIDLHKSIDLQTTQDGGKSKEIDLLNVILNVGDNVATIENLFDLSFLVKVCIDKTIINK